MAHDFTIKKTLIDALVRIDDCELGAVCILEIIQIHIFTFGRRSTFSFIQSCEQIMWMVAPSIERL